MGRIRLAQHFQNGRFCGAVDLRYIIALLLDVDPEFVDIHAGAIDDLAGATRGFYGYVQRGMHGFCGGAAKEGRKQRAKAAILSRDTVLAQRGRDIL